MHELLSRPEAEDKLVGHSIPENFQRALNLGWNGQKIPQWLGKSWQREVADRHTSEDAIAHQSIVMGRSPR